MKKVLLIGLLFAATSANAGIFSSVVTSDWELKKPSSKYMVETYGFDVRVYEWTPKDNPNYTCVFVAGNNNSSGVACYPKKTKKK